MKIPDRPFLAALALVAGAIVLPMRSDGDAALQQCCNASTSLASTRNEYVNGDEAFFKLPNGPANVMILLDASGSMADLPQCEQGGWGSGKCANPTVAAPALNFATGTCVPAAAASWMVDPTVVSPTRTLVEVARSNALLTDNAPWAQGVCAGDGCLFDPDAYYFYDDWKTGGTTQASYATRRAFEAPPVGRPAACIALDAAGNVARDALNNPIPLPADCRACMDTKGFYFYRYRNASGTSSTQLLLRGTFLNANPPKFITARKVVKDLVWMDPALPSKLDQVRMGLAILDDSQAGKQHAQLIVPLGPDKLNSFPPTQTGFRVARQTVLNVLNSIVPGHFDPASTRTPLASALFNVGQYFSTVGFYASTFGSTNWEVNEFKATGTTCGGVCGAGRVNASWVKPSAPSGSETCSICWACQNNSVVLVTDGQPNTEVVLPAALCSNNSCTTGYDQATYTKVGNCGANGASCPNGAAGGGGSANYTVSPLPRVASWLHNTDLRTDFSTGGKQALTIHTVGFGVSSIPSALQILQATANMGGGLFQSVTTAQGLADAVYNAVFQVVAKENSFSAASANSLQTVQTASSEAFLTRFKPNVTQAWEGHLFQAALFDEFLNGCDPTKAWDAQPTVSCGGKTVSANFNGDQDGAGNAICTGVFLIDQDCDEIAEDPQTGDFVKRGLGTPANFPWDAGAVLSDPSKTGYRTAQEGLANSRNIFTYVPDAAGVLTKVAFTTANVATLKPFLNIPAAWCTALLTQTGVPGGTDPTTVCATQVINYVRGWDVVDMDADNCWGPGNPKNTAACPSGTSGEQRDRKNDGRGTPTFYKLGDIFHSSPAVVQAPIDEVRCDTGYEKQCVATLHSPSALANQTKISTAYTGLTGQPVDAYERYRLDNLTRRRVVLVGANDGMLHAFDAGSADTSQKPDPTGSYPYTKGSGEELWAFIPPDLVPRLKNLLSAHQYMVDGSVMVRDVWVDANADQVKTKDEFHTVAIFGERSGGTQYSALDVTDPLNPRMLWSFPKPCSEDERYMAESWSDFAPRPPPIGPVKIASGSDPRGFTEKWIVMLGGGYDPAMTRGRAVFMVDAWSGATVWRFTDDDFKAFSNNGARASMFPVAAGIAMVDIGDTSLPSLDIDGYFDTATWGDLGGNLWVARFFLPGTVGASGRVNNWFAARSFEEQRRADGLQGVTGRNEFFFMTSNAYEPTTRTLRTFLGSGNRERMLDQQAACGPDNLMSCCRAGCTVVNSTNTDNYGSCSATTSFSCSGGFYNLAATSSTCSGSASCGSGGTGFSSSSTLHFECPGAGVLSDSVGTASCDSSGQCAVTPVGTRSINGTFLTPPRNRFYGVWSYGRSDRKAFSTAAQAETFDAARFTDIPYVGTCTGAAATSCSLVDTTDAVVTYAGGLTTPSLQATADDPGWFYEYGRNCPLKSCSPPPPWTDEKTGSGSTVVLGCTAWGGFRPYGMSTSTDPCSGALGTPVTYGYLANFVSGVPSASCGYVDSGVVYRAAARSTTAPPTASTVRVTFSPNGQISYSTLQIDAGAAPGSKTMGTRSEVGEPVYWLEVSRQLHQCRHVDPSTCN